MQMNNNVPDCWDIKKLDAIAKIQRGRFSIRPRNDPAYYGGATPFVQTGDISQSEIFLKKYSQTLNDKGVAVSKIFPKNTILITIAANIGDTAITTFPVACPDSLIGINNKSCDVFWLNYFLQTQKNKLNGLATQNAQKNINLETLNNLKIAVPPVAEQKKIAEILGTWDRAIEELSDLIAEKKELKRGLMQRLLTGTQRLPGFTKPWKKVKINTFLREISEKTTLNNQHKVLSVTKNGVCLQEDYFEKQIASENNIGYKILRKHNLVFSPMNLWMGALGFSDYDIGIVSPAYKIFIVDESVTDYRFLKYFMITPQMIYMYKVNSEIGASIVRRNLDLDGLLSSFVRVPDFEEQKAIADVLSKADSEIDLLNQQLDVLREQKRGLMQKLLTGEIRVKVDTETC